MYARRRWGSLCSASPSLFISNLLDLYSIADIIADYYDTAVNTEKADMVHKIPFSVYLLYPGFSQIWLIQFHSAPLPAWSSSKISGHENV